MATISSSGCFCSKNLHSEKVDNDDGGGVKALDDTDGNDVDEDSLADGNWHSLDSL